MVMSPVGLGTKNQCAGEGQQQFTGLVKIPLTLLGNGSVKTPSLLGNGSVKIPYRC
jgi:hypothetical protein